MSAYRFRLETVLRLRHADEGNARVRLLEKNLALHHAISFRDAQVARLAAIEVPLGPIGRDDLLAEGQRGDLISKSIVLANERLDVALAEAAEAQLSWVVAARKVEALRRLDRRRREEHDSRQQRADAIEIGDVVNAASIRRRSMTLGEE